jgi:hypothetical protein
MYNARLFYNKNTGDILRIQTIGNGEPLPLEDELVLVSDLSGVSTNEIGFLEWDNPENELEAIMADGKSVKVDVTQTPHVVYGENAPEPPEPTDDDEISGEEFLEMVEGVM